MSEFTKLAKRIDFVYDTLLKLKSLYDNSEKSDVELKEGVDSEANVETENEVKQSTIGNVSDSWNLSTTTSATPSFSEQQKWRSRSSIIPEKDKFLSKTGEQLNTDYRTLESILLEIDTKLISACQQFCIKAEAKDSVTDLPRFGVTMKNKITNSNNKILDCSSLGLELKSCILILIEKENESKNIRILEALKEEELSKLKNSQIDVIVSSEDLELKEKENMLKVKAEESRQQKKLHNEILKRLLSALNKRERGLLAIVEATERIKKSCKNDMKKYNEAVNTCMSLLESISARPDNESLRRLKIFNSMLQDRLTGLDGGTALLLALGFTVKLDTEEKSNKDVKEIIGTFSSAGGYISDKNMVASCVKVNLFDDIVRVYAKVHVEINSNGDFVVTTGVDVSDVEVQKKILIPGDMDDGVEMMVEGSGEGGQEVGKIINDVGAVGDSGESNMKIEEDMKSGEEEKGAGVIVIDSDDVTGWSYSLQDYSELYFLCHSTNSHNDVNGSSSANTTCLSTTLVPLILDMKEPNPNTSEGMDKWLSWFDGLKLCKDKLSTLLS